MCVRDASRAGRRRDTADAGPLTSAVPRNLRPPAQPNSSSPRRSWGDVVADRSDGGPETSCPRTRYLGSRFSDNQLWQLTEPESPTVPLMSTKDHE